MFRASLLALLVRQYARVLVVGIALAAGLVGVATIATPDRDCLIVVSGNKLCGGDARAWCDATDPLRDLTAAYQPTARTACDEVGE